MTEGDSFALGALAGVIVLDDLEVDETFRELVVPIDGETNGEGARVVPAYFVFFDGGAGGLSGVFRSRGVG